MSESAKPRRAHAVVEWLLTALLLGALAPLLLDLLLGRPSELAARVSHALFEALRRPAEMLQARGWLPRGAALAELVAVAALLGTGLSALLDPRPGTPHTWARRLLALPLVLALGGSSVLMLAAALPLCAALDPSVFAVLLGAGVLGGLLGARHRREPLAWEQSVSGLPPALWEADHGLRLGLLVLWAGALALVLHVGAESGGIGQPLARLAATLEERGPWAPPWLLAASVVLALLLAPPTRRSLGVLGWEPWVAAAVGAAAGASLGAFVPAVLSPGPEAALAAAPLGAACGFAGTLLSAAGLPAWPRLALHPVRAAGRLSVVILAAAGTVAHALSTSFLGCAALDGDPLVRRLSEAPWAQDAAWLAPQAEAAVAAWRRPARIERLSTGGAESVPLPFPAARLPGAPRPARFVRGPNERPFILLDLAPEGVAALELDRFDATARAVAADALPCEIAAWAWAGALGVGELACRGGEALLLEPDLGAFIARESLRGSGEPAALAADPADGALFVLPRARAPFLVRLDVGARRPRAWRLVGAGGGALLLDPAGTLHVARRVSRTLRAFAAADLAELPSRRVGLGTGALGLATRHEALLTASLVDGQLRALPLQERGATGGRAPRERRLRLGGWLRSVAVSEDGSAALVAGFCGVMAVDLDAWLGGE